MKTQNTNDTEYVNHLLSLISLHSKIFYRRDLDCELQYRTAKFIEKTCAIVHSFDPSINTTDVIFESIECFNINSILNEQIANLEFKF
ncbi:MAG: hypothetical protein PSX81_02640 [bacterium]|nr:hypothetical protein [bacterium]